MPASIVNLRQFYSSPLGKKVRRRLRGMVRRTWPGLSGMNFVGIGYTTDLLPLPRAQADNRILALMPETQGAIYWPIEEHNHSVLADVMRPPFAPGTLHRLLVAHGLEQVAKPDEFLKIWWQMLTPGGRMLLIVPNRHGLWARFGKTPFSIGASYTLQQLRQLLNDASFTLRETRSACFAPPSNHPFWLHLFSLIEWLGCFSCPRMGGVLVVEAEKQIYAGVKVGAAVTLQAPAWAPAPAMSKNP